MQHGSYDTRSSSSRSARLRRRRRQAQRRLFLLLFVALLAVAAFAVLHGRGGSNVSASGKAAGVTARESTAAPAATRTAPPEVWVASKSRPVRVWIGGDSMGGELGWSLAPMLSAARVFRPSTFYKESSGICRYDFFDWQKKIASVVRTARPQAAVVMMGTNDTQSVSRSNGTWIPYGDAAWKKAYEKRVGDIMDTLLHGGARRVYWVGMPIMGESWRNSRMRLINRVVEKQAGMRPGVEYLDSWALFARPDGSFDASLRLSDGVHFTVGGQRKLARVVFKAIRADWLPSGPGTPSASPPASPSASAR